MISILFILFITGMYIAQFIAFLDLFFDVNDAVGYTDFQFESKKSMCTCCWFSLKDHLDSFAGKCICTLALVMLYCHLLGCLCICIYH